MRETISAIIQKSGDVLDTINGFVWGWPLIILLFGTHIYLTIRTGFVQRHLGKMLKITFQRDKNAKGDISHFASLSTALAATIGTGNIIGVATAIAIGGPGAVLWMWLTGVLGMATKYSEALLSVKYRTVNRQGEIAGGPMYVIERAMGMKWLAVLFAIFTCIAAFGIGNMIQSNAIATQVEQFFISPDQAQSGAINTPRVIVGLLLTIATAVTILGGIKSIAQVCKFLVPIMALVYVAGCLALLTIHFDRIPEAIMTILSDAFNNSAAVGGLAGVALREVMRMGIARGLFSNEAGLGSAPIVAAAARTTNPVRQALVSASGTFWDTVVICLLTGIVLVSSGHWQSGFVTGTVTNVSADGVTIEVSKPEVLRADQQFNVTRTDTNGTVTKIGELFSPNPSGESNSLLVSISQEPNGTTIQPGDSIRALMPAKQLANAAFSDLPYLGPFILTFGLLTFVLSTIIGWSYYGEKAVEYLVGVKAIFPYRILWVFAVMIGTLLPLNLIWTFADIANGLMAVPNLICLIVLSGVIAAESRKYLPTADKDE